MAGTGDRLRAELAALLVEQQGVIEQLRERASDNGRSISDIGALLERSQELHHRIQRITAALRNLELHSAAITGASLKGLTGTPPIRDTVAEVLHLLGVPLPARAVSEVAAVVLDRSVPAARLASIRRDEERAYRRRPTARPEWIVPALNTVNLTALPRLVALSSWEPERRLIGPRSPHVNHLRILVTLIDQVERRSPSSASLQRFVALIGRLAAPLPESREVGARDGLTRLRRAAEEELALIEPVDRADRARAARLLLGLSAHEQLWGRLPEALAEEDQAGVRRVWS
jgi:hypothetical protein